MRVSGHSKLLLERRAYVEDVMPRLVRPTWRAAWGHKRVLEEVRQGMRFGGFIGADGSQPVCFGGVAFPSEDGTDKW